MLPIIFALLACGGSDEAVRPDAISSQPEAVVEAAPSGIVARIAAASCGLPEHTDGEQDDAFYAAAVDVSAGTITMNTWSAATGRPPVITPLAADLRCRASIKRPDHDMPLEALLSIAWPCAQDLGSIGGSPLMNQARVDWNVASPERVVVSYPEEEGRTLPSGRDVVIVLRTGKCIRAVMD